jgi:hypothetical protein
MILLKASRILGILLIVIEVASIALFLLCGSTIFSLMSTVTPGGGEIPIEVDETTQTATLTFTFTPRNGGYLDATVNVGFGVTLSDGSYSAKNTTSINLPPGVEKDVSLTLRVPVEKLREYADAKGTLDIYTSIRTLNGLVSLEFNAFSEGGS